MTKPDLNLIVTIDVEEDNWGFDGSDSSIENIRMVPRLQDLFDRYGIKPTYLVTYPVVSSSWAVDILSEIRSQNKCEIGTHLHPWNTPPLQETINEKNSMLKNLQYELQLEKLRVLTDKVASAFGTPPRSFRAGRWGLGPETVKALVQCGYVTDTSVTPTISWLQYGDGPEYPDTITEPYWLSADGKRNGDHGPILEVPATIGFNRWPFELYQKIYVHLQKNWLKLLHPAGLMHFTGALRKIWLSPELSSADDMIMLSKIMIKNGMHFLNLSFHTTTLLPGKSPFVKNRQELEQFFMKIEILLEYLVSSAHVTSPTLSEVRSRMEIAAKDPATSGEDLSPCEEIK